MVSRDWGGDSEERGLQDYYKGHMDKIKEEGGGGGGRWVQLGWGGGMGRKGIQLSLNNNKIFKNLYLLVLR